MQYDATYSNGERETLNELHVKFLGGPMYHDCGNQEWFAALGGGPKGVEFNVTVIDDNYLELRRFGRARIRCGSSTASGRTACGGTASGGTRINKSFIDRNYYKEKEIT